MTAADQTRSEPATGDAPAPAHPKTASLTLEEKASLTSGADFWSTKAVERVGVPSWYLTDGPHGVRKQVQGGDHLGLLDSVPATCFPPAVALGSTWDPELLERVGAALGEEAKAEGVAVLLGPGINIKRSPLCGRNFEYLSEDPIVSGVLGSALVRGLQGQGVGASLKHFAANNQEADRMRVSADIDERPLREIYLRAFQRVVTDEQPWTVMCSYNRINGVSAAENPWLLTDVLRGEWGFDGVVVSDWGAVAHRVPALEAGLDLEMPYSGGRTDAAVVTAVQDGSLDESVLDTAVDRLLRLTDRAVAAADDTASYDPDAHHALAREAAGRSIVLLRNEGGVLPLAGAAAADASDGDIAVIGEFARTPRYQGAGSSQINPTKLDAALDAIRDAAGGRTVRFAPGFTIGESTPSHVVGDDTALAAEAVTAARGASVVLLFLGLPGEEESEGFDREHLELPAAQTELLDAVLAVNANVVVVLANGGVVRVSGWADRVPAIVEGWLLGQAGGGALADVLFGAVNPSGRLAESIPLRIEDTAAYLDFPGEFGHVRYGEGLFVGYRHFDARDIAVSYPFGHGLSYTTFAYGDAAAQLDEAAGVVRVVVPVTNTGSVAGREIVQVYGSVAASAFARPVRELKGFQAVDLEPGEGRDVVVDVRLADLAVFHPLAGRWVVERGVYGFAVGASSRDLRTAADVELAGDEPILPLDAESTIGEWLAHPVGGAVLGQAMQAAAGAGDEAGMFGDPAIVKMMASMPLGRVASFPGSPITEDGVAQLVAAANGS
ncbi:glycoside hydrolase family 3 C-terminal domain-containing protein [Plantibacter sp. YIM 135347]|uniref:glycoside hydrolase family 3 C-terminal domain-containing protein n=1 Tax=Plantibacter sp. YIM 135347 TaxID=3423919 RepID=UPI003D332D01